MAATPPKITKKPQIKPELGGKRIVFTTSIDCNPEPSIEWSKNNAPILGDSDKYNIEFHKSGESSYDLILRINDVKKDDAGEYRFVAKNEAGEARETLTLNFSSGQSSQQSKDATAPVFTKPPQIRQATGGVVVLSCVVAAKPAPTVAWFKANEAIQIDGRRYKATLTPVEDEANSYTVSLTISEIKDGDAGAYRAVAKNDHGEGAAVFTIKSGDKNANLRPNFVAQPKIRQTAEGVTFECVFTSDEKPEVSWNHNGAVCAAGANGKYLPSLQPTPGEPKKYVATLMVKKVGVSDGGEYKCVAKNKYGDSLANINLNIDKPDGQAPTFVEKPIIRYMGRDISVQTIVKASPAPDITWQRTSPGPVTAIKESAKLRISRDTLKDGLFKLTLTVRNFAPNDSGVYSVTVKNALGEAVGNADVKAEQRDTKLGPQLMTTLKSRRNTVADGAVVLSAEFDANPLPAVKWYKGNKELSSSTADLRKFETQIVKDSSSSNYRSELVVQNFQPSADAGTYETVLSNEVGETRLKSEVAPDGNVIASEETTKKSAAGKAASPESAAKMTSKGDDKKKPEVIKQGISYDGSYLRLSLTVDAATEPTARWYYKGISVQGKRYITKIKKKEEYYSVVLDVEEANVKDSGTYKCKVGNNAGDTSVIINVMPNEFKIERNDIPPRFTRKLQPQDVPESQSASYICTITGTEPISWKWTLQGKELSKEDSLYVMDRDGNKLTLTIREVWASDSGEVTCIAENAYGKAVTVGRLYVQENVNLKGLKKRQPAVRPPEDDDGEYMDPNLALLLLRQGAGGPNATKRPEAMEIPPNSPYFETVPDNQCINKGGDFSTEVQINIPDPSLKFPTVKWFFGVPRRRGDTSAMKELKEDNDKRMTIKIDPENQSASFELNRLEQKDEGHYGVCLLDADGDVLDRASFSLFVKDPDQNFDFRNLLKRTHIDEDESSDEEVEWGTLKRTFVPQAKSNKLKKRRGGGSNEMMAEDEEYDDDTLEPLESFSRPRASTFTSRDEGDESNRSYEKRQKQLAEDLENRLLASRQEKMGRRLSLMEAIPNFPVLRKAPKVVVEKGEFEEELEDCSAVQGDTKEVFFSCVFSDEHFKPRWFKGRTEIFLGQKYQMESEGKRHTLMIKAPNTEDTGPYMCEIDGETSTAMLMVEVRRTRILKSLPPLSRISRKGTTVLEVEMSDDKGEPQWFKNGKPLTPKRGKIEIKKEGNKAILIITNGSPEDAAVYACKVEDSSSETTMAFEEGDWKFVEKLSNATTVEDAPAAFSCTVNEPEADVVWLVNGQEVSPDDRRFEIGVNGMKRTLTLKKPKAGDNGLKVTCKTTKEVVDATLTVKGLLQLDDLSASCYYAAAAATPSTLNAPPSAGMLSFVSSSFNAAQPPPPPPMHPPPPQLLHDFEAAANPSDSSFGSSPLTESYRNWLPPSMMGMPSSLSTLQSSNQLHENKHVANNTAVNDPATTQVPSRPISPVSMRSSDEASSAGGYFTPMDIDDSVSTTGTEVYATPMNMPATPDDQLSVEGDDDDGDLDDETMTVVGDPGDELTSRLMLPVMPPLNRTTPNPSPVATDFAATHYHYQHHQHQLTLSTDLSYVFSQPSSPNPAESETSDRTADFVGSLLRPLYLPRQVTGLKSSSFDAADVTDPSLPRELEGDILRPAQRSQSNVDYYIPPGITSDPQTLVQGLTRIKALQEESFDLAARLSHRYEKPPSPQLQRMRQPQLAPTMQQPPLQQKMQQPPQQLLMQASAVPTMHQVPVQMEHQMPTPIAQPILLPTQQQQLQTPILYPQLQQPQIQPQLQPQLQQRILSSSEPIAMPIYRPRSFETVMDPQATSYRQQDVGTSASSSRLSPRAPAPAEFAERIMKLRQEAAELAERLHSRHSSVSSGGGGVRPHYSPMSPQFLAGIPHIDDDAPDDDLVERAPSTPSKGATPKQVSFDLPDPDSDSTSMASQSSEPAPRTERSKSPSFKATIEEKYLKFLSKIGIKSKKEKKSKFVDGGGGKLKSLSEENISLSKIPEEPSTDDPKLQRKSSWRKKLFKKGGKDGGKDGKKVKSDSSSSKDFDKREKQAAATYDEDSMSPSKLVVIGPGDRTSLSLASSAIQQISQRLLQPIEEVSEQPSMDIAVQSKPLSSIQVHRAVTEKLDKLMEEDESRRSSLAAEQRQYEYQRAVKFRISSMSSSEAVPDQPSPAKFRISSTSSPEAPPPPELPDVVATQASSPPKFQAEPSKVMHWLGRLPEQPSDKPPSDTGSAEYLDSGSSDYLYIDESDRETSQSSLLARQVDVDWKFRSISRKYKKSTTSSTEEPYDIEAKYQKILERYSMKRQVSDVSAEVGSAEKAQEPTPKMSWDRKAQFSLDANTKLHFEGPAEPTSPGRYNRKQIPRPRGSFESALESTRQGEFSDSVFTPSSEENLLSPRPPAKPVVLSARDGGVPIESTVKLQSHYADEARAGEVQFQLPRSIEIKTFGSVDFANPTFRELPELMLTDEEQRQLVPELAQVVQEQQGLSKAVSVEELRYFERAASLQDSDAGSQRNLAQPTVTVMGRCQSSEPLVSLSVPPVVCDSASMQVPAMPMALSISQETILRMSTEDVTKADSMVNLYRGFVDDVPQKVIVTSTQIQGGSAAFSPDDFVTDESAVMFDIGEELPDDDTIGEDTLQNVGYQDEEDFAMVTPEDLSYAVAFGSYERTEDIFEASMNILRRHPLDRISEVSESKRSSMTSVAIPESSEALEVASSGSHPSSPKPVEPDSESIITPSIADAVFGGWPND